MIKALISKLTGSVSAPADFSLLHADMHSHFIPGIDDGAKTMDESLELITSMHAIGLS